MARPQQRFDAQVAIRRMFTMSFIRSVKHGWKRNLELQNYRMSKLEFTKVISPAKSHIRCIVLSDGYPEPPWILRWQEDQRTRSNSFSVWVSWGIRKYILRWYGVCISVNRFSSLQFLTLMRSRTTHLLMFLTFEMITALSPWSLIITPIQKSVLNDSKVGIKVTTIWNQDMEPSQHPKDIYVFLQSHPVLHL